MKRNSAQIRKSFRGSRGKRILVTGGSRGLGLAICRRLLTEGYHVVMVSRSVSPELKKLRQAAGERLEHHSIDLMKPSAVQDLSQRAGLLDGVDGFVSNAGVGTHGLLTLLSPKAIEESLQLNLLVPMLLAREVLKGMLTRGGSLVFVSSVAARTGLTGLSTYGAAKGGLLAFSAAIAREFGRRNVRSNVILPGFLETGMSESLATPDRERVIRRTALRRLGKVEDAVGCVSFLLSDDARYVTGAEFVVDGGLLA